MSGLDSVRRYLHERRATYLLADFFTFCRDTGLIAPIFEQPHREMCDELEACTPIFGESRQRKELYLAPRRTYKTSLLAVFIIYLILRYPDIRIGLGRATHENAKQILLEIKQKLQNPLLVEVFGDLSKGALVWSADGIIVNTRKKAFKEPTVGTFGLDTSLTGQHLDVVFCDDFVDQTNYQSRKALAKGRIVLQSLYPIMEPHGSIVVTGTRWAANDLYGWLLTQDDELEDAGEEREWRRYIRGAYVDSYDAEGNLDRDFFFPAQINEEFLGQMRRSTESKLFSSWYLNSPVEEGLKVFGAIEHFDGDYYASPRPEIIVASGDGVTIVPVYVTMTIDPALLSNPTNDQLGVVVNGTDPEDEWWILHAEGFRKVPSEQASRVLYLIRHYLPSIVLLESAGADAEFTARLATGIADLNATLAGERRIELQSYAALRDEAPGRRGKAQRIEAMEPRFRERRARLARGTTGDLRRQLESWPDIDFDDVIDACAMQRAVARPSSERVSRQSADRIEELEEAASWGPGGRPAPDAPAPRGRTVARVGRGSQALPSRARA